MRLRQIVNSKFNKSNFPIILILALSIFLRVLGTNPGYPPIHPDEPKIADSAIRIAFYGDFKPVAYYYGQLLPLLYAGVNIVFFVPLFFAFVLPINLIVSLQKGNMGTFGCFLQSADDIRYCILTRSQDFFFYLARYETAIAGSLSVLLVYLLGKRLFSTKVGIVAAFFTAVNYRHVLSSTLSLADAPAATFALLSVLLSLALLTNRSVKTYVLAGIGLAMVLSIKYFFYTIPIFFLCHLISVWKISGKTIFQRIKEVFFSPKFILSLIITLALFLIINPFLFLDWKEASSQLGLNFHFYRIDSSSTNLAFGLKSLFPIYYLFKYGIGQILSVLILLGFFYSIFRYPKGTLLLSSVILPFFYFFLVVSGANFVRNYTVIIPFLLIFPAILITDSVHYLKIGSRTLPILVIAVFLIGLPSLKNSFLLSSSFARTQNQELLLNFIVDNIPNDATLAHTWGAPVPSYKPTKTINWSPWPSGFMSLEELRGSQVEWVAVSSEATTFVANELWTGKNDIVQRSFLDDRLLQDLLKNNYASLVVQELGDFRVKEFTKPYWQSTDPSFFVAKLPSWAAKAGTPIVSFKFEEEGAWSISSLLGESQYEFMPSKGDGYGNSVGMKITQSKSCPLAPVQYSVTLSKISSPPFAVSPGKWYILSAFGRRELKKEYVEVKNGFVRLDFYSSSGRRLKTHVSRQLSSNNKWESLSTFGIAPEGSTQGRVSFQLDYCNEGEKYFLDNLEVSEAKVTPVISPAEYPYFGKPLPQNFGWLPPL